MTNTETKKKKAYFNNLFEQFIFSIKLKYIFILYHTIILYNSFYLKY